ncbi:esterase [Caballeronia telluris]|uniref:Esterase n=2 Tax=Caballeronia telluris TaxID=326475 RepID=A0A158F4N4_9BURK|nr:alpha/beta hydrolase-fold protein [Caballeronia telluris]SAL14777.1 esterase [Caballeronia telluris]
MLFANRRAPRVKTRLTVSLVTAGAIAAAHAAPQAASTTASESMPGATAVRHAAASAKPMPAVLTSAAGSKVVARTMHSEALDRDWPYVLYLPPGYAPRDERYPVLYLLHGNNGDAYDWITQGRLQAIVDRLIAQREIPPLLIVMPQGGTDWYVDRKESIETAFFEELMPEIETKYAAQTGREGRVIGGVSMGGFGALRYAMTRPQLFCGAMLLGPAIYAGAPPVASAARYVGVFGDRQFDPLVWRTLNYPAQWQTYMSRGLRVPMFIAAGDDDLRIQAEASLLYTQLREAKQPAELRIIDGGHTWAVWSALLAEGLKYSLACTR